MVNYNICYDIVSFVMLLVITLLFLVKRGIRNYQNRLYFLLVLGALLGTTADIVDILFINAGSNIQIWMKYISSGSCYVLQGMEALLVMFYFMGITNSWWKVKKKTKLALAVPYLIVVLLVFSTANTHAIFYYDEAGIYHRGPLCILTYILAMLYLAIAAGHIWYVRRFISHEYKIILTLLTTTAALGMVIQSLFPGMVTQMFASAMCLFIVFFTLQNPYLAIDNNLRVYNRSSFIQMTSLDFAAGKKLSMILITLNDYAFLQRSLGTGSMRELLRKIIRQLKALDRNFLVYHINDACFCMVLNSYYQEKKIQDVMSKLSDLFAKPWKINEITTVLSVYFCQVECPRDTDNVEGIFDIVTGMMEMKQDSRVISLVDMDIKGRNLQRKKEQVIKEALADENYELYMRSIYSVVTRKAERVELNLRLPDGDGGYLYTGECKPFLEKAGLIFQVGSSLFKEACRYVSKNENPSILGVDIGISIFLCIQQEYLDEISRLMKEYQIKPGLISLKMNESEAIDASGYLQNMMKKFTQAGVGFTLEGYGTGYSNIAYVYELPFSCVEMEKKVLDAALTDAMAMDILKNSIRMLHELDMQVIIDEQSEESQSILRSIGCDYQAGSYIPVK